MEDKHYAVLIDSDNISAKYITAILDEMTKYGVVTYKRIYGDWTSNQASKWREELLGHSITPIQQFCNTVGKNATDSALIIDAMDILYTGHVDGFCLVSSDGDFTKLASRLRESGMYVIGMGESKTPKSFKAACSVFTNLEVLCETDVDKPKENISQQKIEEAISEIVMGNENGGRKTGLGEVGSMLLKKYSDFDVRNYGYSSLSKFLEEMQETFVMSKIDNAYYVSLKRNKMQNDELHAFIINEVTGSGEKGIDLGLLGQHLHKRFSDFKVKEYGYSTWQKYVSSVPDLEVISQGNAKRVILREPEKTEEIKRSEPVIAQSRKTSINGRKKKSK